MIRDACLVSEPTHAGTQGVLRNLKFIVPVPVMSAPRILVGLQRDVRTCLPTICPSPQELCSGSPGRWQRCWVEDGWGRFESWRSKWAKVRGGGDIVRSVSIRPTANRTERRARERGPTQWAHWRASDLSHSHCSSTNDSNKCMAQSTTTPSCPHPLAVVDF